jgi:hypothetical protein
MPIERWARPGETVSEVAMTVDVLWEAGLDLLASGVLVAANGSFVAPEFAPVTVRRARVDQFIAEGTAWPLRFGARSINQTDTSPRRS